MSADEFDPFVERAFSRAPRMPDADLFAAGVEARLASRTKVRTLALSVAGLIGGVIAVRESLTIDIDLGRAAQPVAGRALGQSLEAASMNAQSAVQASLDQWGLADVALGSMGGMQLFWLATAALIALATAGVMKLSQEV